MRGYPEPEPKPWTAAISKRTTTCMPITKHQILTSISDVTSSLRVNLGVTSQGGHEPLVVQAEDVWAFQSQGLVIAVSQVTRANLFHHLHFTLLVETNIIF